MEILTAKKPKTIKKKNLSLGAKKKDALAPKAIESEQKEAELETTLQTEEEEDNFYQAIGWLKGEVSKNEEGKLQITFRDSTSFQLTGDPRVLQALYKQVEQHPGPELCLQCYPQYNLIDKVLYFKVANFFTEEPEEARPGIFILRGVWQFIPQNRRPVFSIHRNEKRPTEEKVKSQHLPLIWKDQEPFKYQKESPERPKFYQIEARLISRRACFGWIRNLAEPTKPPSRVKNVEKGKGKGKVKKKQLGDKAAN